MLIEALHCQVFVFCVRESRHKKILQFKFPGSNKTRVSTSRVLAEGSSVTYTRAEGPLRFNCARQP